MEEMILRNWYDSNSQLYMAFCQRIEKLIEEILEEKNIPYQSVTCRTKSWKSFCDKCNNKYGNFENPVEHVMDMAGIRIIAYINSDVSKISDIIKQEFEIDPQNSVNKADQMEENQVGYLSVHYIAKLNDGRVKLPEYEKFKDMCCEIQVRTLLQHAWAEFEHDRNYKFGKVLPRELRRKFYLLAGTLENIDSEFQNLSDEIDRYGKEIIDETGKGNLDLSIDSTSLLEYMNKKLKDISIPYRDFHNQDKILIGELNDFGIFTLKDLDKIIRLDYLESLVKVRSRINYLGILRNVMVISDCKKYFEKCWKRHWGGMYESEENFLKARAVPTDELEKYLHIHKDKANM